jgi:hypothetical protein
VKDTIEECFEDFLTISGWKPYHVFPILISWGIWLARNAGLFKGIHWPTFKVVPQTFYLFPYFKVQREIQKPGIGEPMMINKSKP